MLEGITNRRGRCRVVSTLKALHAVDPGFGNSIEEARENYLKNVENYTVDVIHAASAERVEQVLVPIMVPYGVDAFGEA